MLTRTAGQKLFHRRTVACTPIDPQGSIRRIFANFLVRCPRTLRVLGPVIDSYGGRVDDAVSQLIERSQCSAPHELPALVAATSAAFDGSEAQIYLADLQQRTLVPSCDPTAAPSTTSDLGQTHPASSDWDRGGSIFDRENY